MDRSTVAKAQSIVKKECQGSNLRLIDKEEDFNALIEWRLYQTHKPLHTKAAKKQTSSGMYSPPTDDWDANRHA